MNGDMPDRMHADEVQTDVDLVRRLITQQFSQWADLEIEPVASNGTVNALYRLGNEMVVRLPRTNGSREDVEQQRDLLNGLRPHLPFAIPVPLAVGRPAEGYPWPWSIYSWLAGTNPDVDGGDDGVGLATDLAEFVTALRAVDTGGATRSGRGVGLATRDGATRAAIRALNGVVDIDRVTAIWEQSLAAPTWDDPPVWIHGDLLPDNLLVEDARLQAVIDFGAAGVGDPACDVIPAWSVLSSTTRKTFREAVAVDDATWDRGRGWALSIALIILPYYRESHPPFVALATRMIDEILADPFT